MNFIKKIKNKKKARKIRQGMLEIAAQEKKKKRDTAMWEMLKSLDNEV